MPKLKQQMKNVQDVSNKQVFVNCIIICVAKIDILLLAGPPLD